MPTGVIFPASGAVLYAALGVLVAWRWRRASPLLLAASCIVTAVWAASLAAAQADPLSRLVAAADLARATAWFLFLHHLYRMAQVSRGPAGTFLLVGALAAAAATAAAIAAQPGPSMLVPLAATAALGRITLGIIELLLIENLYFNLPEHERWHVALPTVLLGVLACFDIVQGTGTVVFHSAWLVLDHARLAGMMLIAPLLLVAAMRGHRWKSRVRISRTAAFHSASMIVSGGVLLVLGAAGELSRRLDEASGWLAQATLAFVALVVIGLLLTSGTARSRLQRLIIDHFFAERFDYRRQWKACIRTLSGEDGDLQGSLATRAVRAMAEVVDSPAGALFLRDGSAGPYAWAGSWNVPAIDAIPPGHPVIAAMRGGTWVARLDGPSDPVQPPLDGLGPLWLAVPLLRRAEPVGLVLLAPPRAPFPLEDEVFALLRIVAGEIATYIAEQRATQTLLQTRQLHDYSKRFAFVAHDIKNVSSQLALLSANAKQHMANPAFQKDMLDTVDASVRKITALLQRLERPEVDAAPEAAAPLPRLEALAATYGRVRGADVALEHDGSTGTVAIGMDLLETAVTHLLNNAVEASNGARVLLRVRHEARQVLVEIVDRGPGMSPEFVRDRLFRPFTTSKAGGSGIGAFQAREMLREAGGDLVVETAPGKGTIMRLLLPRTDAPGSTMGPPRRTLADAAR